MRQKNLKNWLLRWGRLSGIGAFGLLGTLLCVAPVSARPEPPMDHVIVFIFENKGFRDIIGNPDASFINRIGERHGLLTDYHAMAHPSLPNYAALVSGKTDGAHSDDPRQRFSDRTVVELMVSKGLSVKGYFQGLPNPGYLGDEFPAKKPLYVVRHNPFFLFSRMRSSPDWRQRIVPIGQLDQDLANGHLPSLSIVVGDLCHDMHGGNACSEHSPSSLVRSGDRFLKGWVDRIRQSSEWRKKRTAIIVTWDEGRYPVWQRVRNSIQRKHPRGWGGRVPLLVLTSFEKGPRRLGGYEDHRRLVRTIGAIFGIPDPTGGSGKMLPPELFTGSAVHEARSR
ncbi:MAG: alkaline phosphatase family protein [Leptospirales bacterium]